MPAFPKPAFPYEYSVATEVKRLRAHRRTREVPARAAGNLVVATWNIANFGLQARRPQDLALIAEIVSWFDLVAIQECREDCGHLQVLLQHLGRRYRLLFSDVAGNNERMVFVYNAARVSLLEKIGEVAIPPAQFKSIRLAGVARRFDGFDRNPYLATFRAGRTSFLFVNVHSYFGSEKKEAVERRALETYAVARWADQRRRSKVTYTREVFAMGDFNMPKRQKGDPIYDALTRLGLEVPEHSSDVGSSIASDKHYDQVAFFPGASAGLFVRSGVFDYDAVLFKTLWESRPEKDFKAYCRYYISDHRPMWVQLAPRS